MTARLLNANMITLLKFVDFCGPASGRSNNVFLFDNFAERSGRID